MRINTVLSGGLNTAEGLFNSIAQGYNVEVYQSSGIILKYVKDASGNMLAQLRITKSGKINVDVWSNGVYEDIHFID